MAMANDKPVPPASPASSEPPEKSAAEFVGFNQAWLDEISGTEKHAALSAKAECADKHAGTVVIGTPIKSTD